MTIFALQTGIRDFGEANGSFASAFTLRTSHLSG